MLFCLECNFYLIVPPFLYIHATPTCNATLSGESYRSYQRRYLIRLADVMSPWLLVTNLFDRQMRKDFKSSSSHVSSFSEVIVLSIFALVIPLSICNTAHQLDLTGRVNGY